MLHSLCECVYGGGGNHIKIPYVEEKSNKDGRSFFLKSISIHTGMKKKQRLTGRGKNRCWDKQRSPELLLMR